MAATNGILPRRREHQTHQTQKPHAPAAYPRAFAAKKILKAIQKNLNATLT
jgi:hypothetical protein